MGFFNFPDAKSIYTFLYDSPDISIHTIIRELLVDGFSLISHQSHENPFSPSSPIPISPEVGFFQRTGVHLLDGKLTGFCVEIVDTEKGNLIFGITPQHLR